MVSHSSIQHPEMKTFPSKFPFQSALRIAAFFSGLTVATNSLRATNYTWNNTGTAWNSPASWTPTSGIPNAGGDVAVFNSASVTSPEISTSVSISRLTANSSSSTGYTLSSSAGATLTLGALTTGTSSAINYTPGSGLLTIAAPVILG